MSLEEEAFDASTFSKNRERLAKEDLALVFFDVVVRKARRTVGQPPWHPNYTSPTSST